MTPEWLTTALRQGGLERLVVDTVGHERVGTGQMASCFRLDVRYSNGDGPASLVVKLPSPVADARAAAASTYRTEVSFYRDLAPTLTIDVPRCYFADFAEDGARFVLLLENLAPAAQGDQIAGCSVEQARAAVTNLGGLHGPRWCDASLREVSWLAPLGLDNAAGTAAVLQQMVAPFVERFEIAEADAGVLRTFAAHAAEWLSGRRERFGPVHGDYRLDNLMFATPQGGRPCSAVDWQLVSLGLPARDLGFFLSTGLEPDELEDAEADLVGAYHDALLGHGVPDYGIEQCRDDYYYAMFQAPLITVLGAMFAPATERGDEMFRVMSRRCCEAIRRAGALDMLP